MNHLVTFVVAVVVFLHFKSLLSQVPQQNISDFEEILVQSFKVKLLKELGLSSVPNVSASKAPKIPTIYKNLVEAQNRKFRQLKEEEDDFDAKTKRIFLFPERVADVAQISGKTCAFKLNSVNSHLEIKSATLWFHITETPKSTGKVIHESHLVWLYKAFKVADPRELFHSQQLNNTGWYSVQISAVVKEWFSLFSKQDLSLDIAVNGPNTLEVGCWDGEANKPFLVVDTEEKKQLNRKRRNAGQKNVECNPTPPKTCCRHSMEVNFHDIGYDFIIYPQLLNIYACAGSCESHSFHKYPVRSQIFRRLDMENNTCCRPIKMAPLSVIFLDKDMNVLVDVIPDVQVLSCKCLI